MVGLHSRAFFAFHCQMLVFHRWSCYWWGEGGLYKSLLMLELTLVHKSPWSSCLGLLTNVLVIHWFVASGRLRKSKLPADRSHVVSVILACEQAFSQVGNYFFPKQRACSQATVVPKHSPTPRLTCFYSHGHLTQTCTALAINNVAIWLVREEDWNRSR